MEIEHNFNWYMLSAWLCRGSAFLNLHNYREAIISYDRAIEIKPNCYEAWYNRGIAMQNTQRYYEAIFCDHKVLEIKPDYQAAKLNLTLLESEITNN